MFGALKEKGELHLVRACDDQPEVVKDGARVLLLGFQCGRVGMIISILLHQTGVHCLPAAHATSKHTCNHDASGGCTLPPVRHIHQWTCYAFPLH